MTKKKGFGASNQQLSQLMFGKTFSRLSLEQKKKVRSKKKKLG